MSWFSDEQKAKAIGKVDAFLTWLFIGIMYGLTELVSWAVTLLPHLGTWQAGKYAWAQVPLSILLGGLLKGWDRKKHEDPTPSTGLVKL